MVASDIRYMIVNRGNLSYFTKKYISTLINKKHREFIKEHIESFLYDLEIYIPFNIDICPVVYDISNKNEIIKKSLIKNDDDLSLFLFRSSPRLINIMINISDWLNNHTECDLSLYEDLTSFYNFMSSLELVKD